MRGALYLLALAAFGRVHFDPLGGDGSIQGGPDANLATTCVAPGGGCSFFPPAGAL